MKYYWCVNCGYNGIFPFERFKNVKCESCNYDGLTEYSKEEWEEEGKQARHKQQIQDPYYNKELNNDK